MPLIRHSGYILNIRPDEHTKRLKTADLHLLVTLFITGPKHPLNNLHSTTKHPATFSLKLPIPNLAQPGNAPPQWAVGSTAVAGDLLYFTKPQRTKGLFVSAAGVGGSRGRHTQQGGDGRPTSWRGGEVTVRVAFSRTTKRKTFSITRVPVFHQANAGAEPAHNWLTFQQVWDLNVK